MMRYLFPMPWHSVLLWVVWLLLNGSSAGHMVLGAVIAFLIPLVTYRYVRSHRSVSKPGGMALYLLRLLKDIVIANIDVARKILAPNDKLSPGWIAFPLSIQEPFPATLLASSISLTPGTVSVEFSSDRKWLYIHALHLENEAELIEFIRRRYELPLKEIFAC
ncbi:MAG: Na+/H+ antiporter subunit E [Oleibacter sp.]|nr:Na+/H+ antiporter subunit E [Thalassolituus sp.]